MTDDRQTKLRLEIAHVLFLDIVGYSKLLIDEQAEALQELNQIVRNTDAAREAEAANQLIRLPTGDGMALVFTGTVEVPVECALQISQALRAKPTLPVRMGIHSGPVHHVADVNQRENIAGAGINIAQRVMDCGDGGHILISKRVADDLAQYRQWQPYLHALGDCEVKHGEKISVVNLYAGEVGNPEPPQKFRTVRQAAAAEKTVSPRKSRLLALGILTIGLLLISLAIVAVIFAPAAIKSFSQSRVAATPNSSMSAAPVIPEKSIAVLPFENLSDDKQNAYFADGIQDEILTKLASIADLKVISRTSTAKYKSKPEDLKTVSQQLGVATVLEGTVQKAVDKVRVNVQLIDARADAHLWANSYDRDLKDVFAVESEVSQEVADALRAKLSPSEANVLARAPTRDPEAYDLFLKGEYELDQGYSLRLEEWYDRADGHFRQSLARDPDFALAAARLAFSRLARHWWLTLLTPADLDEVKTILNRALALAPNLSELHESLGMFYYWGHRDYEPALKEFQRALELQPNNWRATWFSGAVHRRQAQWERSLVEMTKAEELNPRDAEIPAEIGLSYVALREWNEAKRFASRALALDPHSTVGMADLVFSAVNGEGDIEAAARALAKLPLGARLKLNATRGSVSNVIDERTYLHVFRRDFAAALKDSEKENADPEERMARLSARVAIRVLAGNAAAARAEGEQARALLEARLRERPDDAFAMTQLSWAYLALGRNADALRLAHQAAASLPIEVDAMSAPLFATGLAQIQARAGESREAINGLRRLLSIPAGWPVSLKRLQLDPAWDPVRNDPEFQQLLAGKEQIGPNK